MLVFELQFKVRTLMTLVYEMVLGCGITCSNDSALSKHVGGSRWTHSA
jgi:hypothetical protein